LPGGGVTIVVASDGENERVIFLIGFIELAVVEGALAVEVNHVSKVVIKGRDGISRSVGIGKLLVHGFSNDPFDVIPVNAARIANGVKGKHAVLYSSLGLLRQNHVHGKIQVREIGRRWRNEPGMRFGYSDRVSKKPLGLAYGLARPRCQECMVR